MLGAVVSVSTLKTTTCSLAASVVEGVYAMLVKPTPASRTRDLRIAGSCSLRWLSAARSGSTRPCDGCAYWLTSSLRSRACGYQLLSQKKRESLRRHAREDRRRPTSAPLEAHLSSELERRRHFPTK